MFKDKEEHPIDKYIGNKSWKLKENANHIYCVGHLMNYIANDHIKSYWLNNVFSKKAKTFHESGKIHIHDMSRLVPYCSGFSTSEVIKRGLKGPNGRISSSPPNHMNSAINQLTNFVGVLSQEFAGAIALNDFSMYLAPFVHYDKLDYKRVKQEIQQFVFHMNQPNRWAGESPFTNITINLAVPDDMKDVKSIVGGEERSKTYGELEKEMNMINEAILEVLIEGDSNGTPMTFPVLTVGIDENFPWDSEIATKIFQVTAKYGTPFFENFKKGTGRDPSDVRSLCCRLSLSKEEIRKHTGGIFGNSDSMGSLGVVTINLNRIGYLAKTKEEYYKLVGEYMDVAKEVLVARRKKLNLLFDQGLYPYTKFYLKNYKNYFSTIGVIGGNESMLNFMNKNLMNKDALHFMDNILRFMSDRCTNYQRTTGDLFNLEAVPGEGCMYSLALKDQKNHSDIILSGKDTPFLSNSTLPPVEEKNFLEVIRTQEPLQTLYTGGTTLNIYIGEKLSNYKQAKSLVKNLVEKTNIPYFSLTPVYSICRTHGYISGETYTCPICKKKTEVFSRVVGYLKPKQQFNPGKTEEFKRRKYYDISDIEQIGEKIEIE